MQPRPDSVLYDIIILYEVKDICAVEKKCCHMSQLKQTNYERTAN